MANAQYRWKIDGRLYEFVSGNRQKRTDRGLPTRQGYPRERHEFTAVLRQVTSIDGVEQPPQDMNVQMVGTCWHEPEKIT